MKTFHRWTGFAIGIFALLCGRSLGRAEVIPLAEDLWLTSLDASAWMVTHRAHWEANGLLVHCGINDKEWILVDTPWDSLATAAVLDWIESREKNPRILAVNSHFHRDNLGGNTALRARHIAVWGSDRTVSLLAERGESVDHGLILSLRNLGERQVAERLEASPLVPPDHLFPLGEGRSFRVGDETVLVVWPGAGHSPDNLVVYFPERRLLFGGCLVKSAESRSLGNLGDADVDAWPQSLQYLKDHFPETERVIPGHGAFGSVRLIDHSLELLKTYLTR